ncbi:MAG TPA: response regulator transcription factor [Actinomycetota bacterium]|nr:response regulator transcription factor [Actinomycetota bacterium]
MKVLVVEDEDRIASFLVKGLRAEGYAVDRVAGGMDALARTRDPDLDLVILDLGLPDMDGSEVLLRIRQGGVHVPVIILTARGDVDDRVAGLDLGADDYLAKPFAFDELLARVRARLRRRGGEQSLILTAGEVRLDLRSRRATVDGKAVELTAREFALLETFMRHPKQVLSREQLLSRVWGLGFDPGSNLVDVYVGYLRKKLGETCVETVRGVGYRLADGQAAE